MSGDVDLADIEWQKIGINGNVVKHGGGWWYEVTVIIKVIGKEQMSSYEIRNEQRQREHV